jgi:phosphoribosyl-AMP cyclohydrolase
MCGSRGKYTTKECDMDLVDAVKFNDKGLVTVIAQDFVSSEVLMVAYMNKDTLNETIEKGVMVYFSRSRQKSWFKGETSGHVQKVREMYIDCDGDALLFKVEQTGAACHENYFSCFFRKNEYNGWKIVKMKIEE